VAKVVATPDYLTLIARLVDAPPPPPQTSLEKWRRYTNKKLGWPSTPDVAILSAMLITLRDKTGSVLSLPPESPLDRVAVTRAPLSGLREEDFDDALEYAGLRSWLISPPESQAGLYPTRLAEAHAVFAANGNGLCANYKNLFECWEEEERMPEQTVFLASFTQQALHAAVGILRAPFHWSQRPLSHVTDLDAGLACMDKYEFAADFWAHVRARLASLARRSSTTLTKVLLAGENATEPNFLAALRDGLAGFMEVGGVEIETVADPTFAGARGAALYARWRQEAPFGCRESAECEEERKKERAEHTREQGEL